MTLSPSDPDAALPLDTVIEGCCLTEMARLPDGCVDLVFADPPTTCN